MLYRFICKLFNSKPVICATLLFYTGIVSAHDATQGAIQVKPSPPISFYQGLMIAVALGYGCYLLWRAKTRNRAGENVEENHP
jgi:hypothetical protein